MNKILSCVYAGVVGLGSLFSLHAAPTPLSEPIPEATETVVRCLFEKKNARLPRFKSEDFAVSLKEGEYSYKLWIPKGYGDQPGRRWPCLFIADPGGNAKMGPMSAHLKASDYIVVMLIESRNGEDGRCWENFLAAHDDVVKRLRVSEGLKFATGMSGGARAASTFVQFRQGFGGLFLQAAGYLYNKTGSIVENLPRRNFCIAVSIGANDAMNFIEVPKIFGQAPKGVPMRSCISDVGHGWAKEDTAFEAFHFMECTTLLSLPSTPELRPTAKTWLARHASVIAGKDSKGDRLLMAEATLKAAGKHNLVNDPALAGLKTSLPQWNKEPAAAAEIKADKAFWSLYERSHRDLLPSSLYANVDAAAASKRAAADFESFARRNSGTDAATRAELTAKGLNQVKKR